VELWLYFAEGNCVKFYLCVVFNHPIQHVGGLPYTVHWCWLPAAGH